MLFVVPTRRTLLAGASLSALAIGSPAVAAAPRIFSPAWFAARVDSSAAAGAAAATGAGALTRSATTTRNLATMARQLASMQAAQAAAAASAGAAAASAIPDGLGAGGLQQAPGADHAGSTLWLGARQPQTAIEPDGRSAVTITQTAPQATLTWQTFNVGKKTDLTFIQQIGTVAQPNWVVLNRVEDPAAQPSQILGSITAPGKVFVINANGIVFGAGSQVSLGALIAATADISAAQFATGIYGAPTADGRGFTPSFTGAAPDSMVIVEPGAAIATTAPSPTNATAAGGYVMLLGGAVSNGGQISTPGGQTVLAAGQDFILRPGYSTTGNQTATVQGSQVASCYPFTAGVCTPLPGSTAGTTLGSTTNTGLITATLGDVTLVGHDVTQAGVVMATTSVSTRGTVHLLANKGDTTGNIILAPGSVTTVQPDDAAATALDSQRQSLIALSTVNGQPHTVGSGPQLSDVSTLPDRLDQSRVEIVTGGFVQFDDTSLTMAQGGQISVQAGYRVWAGDGAALDVSGSTSAVLPMSSNQITVSIQGNELRDAPVNRDTGLITSNNVTLDLRTLLQVAAGTNGYSTTRDYTQGGLLEVGGYLSNLGHTIGEWDAVGGTITLAGRSVVSQPGADFNLAGGGVTVAGGLLGQSYLIGPGGQLYNANTAPANLLYTGVYGGFVQTNDRFGLTRTYANSLVTPTAIQQSGYSYGRDAGSLVVQAPTAVLEGQIEAGVSNGVDQIGARPAIVPDAYGLSQSTIAQPGSLLISGLDAGYNVFNSPITIAGDYTPLADSITPGGLLPDGVANKVALSASQLSAERLGGVFALSGTGTIDITGPLTLADGGTLTLAGAAIAVGGDLTARGGRITLGDIATVNGSAVQLLPILANGGGVSFTQGSTVDLRGVWTNATLNAANVAGEGLVNGGTLAIDSLRGLTLPAGSLVDVSAGGAVLAGDKIKGGTGGSIALIGDDRARGGNTADAPVEIAAGFVGYGTNGGGTLTLTAPHVLVADAGASVPAQTVLLDPATFQTGFSDYVVNGFNGLSVAPGTAVSVAEPVYAIFGDGTLPINAPIDAPTGTDPAAVFQVMLLPVYQQNAATARLTQRKGASLAFLANHQPGLPNAGGGDITLGAGSSISVDPGQSVRIEAYGQITDDARITARGGNVAIVNEEQGQVVPKAPLNTALALSVWIGGDARIDVSGNFQTALDASGRRYGVVNAGGTITLGADVATAADGGQVASDANVVIAQGAVLNADGAAATIDLLAGTPQALGVPQTDIAAGGPIRVATAGGTINLRSYASIDLLGIARARAGGDGAAGGTLSMVLEDPVFTSANGTKPVVPDALLTPRIITVSQTQHSPLDGQTVAAGAPLPIAAYGQAAISQDQIRRGGFDTLSLYARDLISFDDHVTLRLGAAVLLNQGIVTDTSRSGVVRIDAPYVLLNGAYDAQVISPSSVGISINGTGWKPYAHSTESRFIVDASLIDVNNAVRFGITEDYAVNAGSATLSRSGFADISLDSTGDIRFLLGTPAPGTTGTVKTVLTTPGNVTLQGAQVYPVSGANGTVLAGVDVYARTQNQLLPGGTITIRGTGSVPDMPYSVGGALSLDAAVIVQDGVLRAPEGSLSLGTVGVTNSTPLLTSGDYTYSVTLQPGSITSTSLDGLSVPYGGTVDGVTYSYNGAPIGSVFAPSISIEGQTQSVLAGATLDLSGGGTLAGAGFITGRGGSVNTLLAPFPVFDAATHTLVTPSLAQQPVYAILPGYQSGYAPLSPVEQSGSYGSVPAIGAQITIRAGVPGIAPGTYTLLPSYYALQPGAARVQIVGGYDSTPGVQSLGAGSFETNATSSTANTGFAGAQPVAVIVTTGAGVLENSQFNQESYSAFTTAQAVKFGTPRGALPEDGKTLNLVFAATAAKTTALDFAGNALFNGAAGGFAGGASLGGQGSSAVQLEITADGASHTKHFVSIEASALDALGAPSLVLGGVLQRNASILNQQDFIGSVAELEIRSGATLTGPQIFLTAESSGGRGPSAGSVTVAQGAAIDTIGQGAAPVDTQNSGLYYNANGYALVALSNGSLVFTPNTPSNFFDGAVTIENGATLLTGGSLNFITTKSLSLGDMASYGAQSLDVGVTNVNFVSDAAQAQAAAGMLILPSGFQLTEALLSRLLNGDPATGAPPLRTLVLSATDAVNFAGSVAIDTTSLQSFVLDTPTILGYGGAGDLATIKTGTLYWSGIELGAGTPAASSAPAAGAIADGPGTGTGSFAIDAQSIILGFGPNTRADDQTTLNRLIEGFTNVSLTASTSLSANGKGTLSVYQSQGATQGAPGTGGDLTITTPLLTGAAASVDGITAGGALTLNAGGAAPSSATTGALGAEIDLSAASIADSTAIVLNAGRLTMNAGTLALGVGARIDLAGQSVALVDQTVQAGGGSLALTAGIGGISTDAATSIDVSAIGAAAGSVVISDLSGAVSLAGAISGGADAGQTGGSFTLAAGTIPDFDALNQTLDTGAIYGSRGFEIATGDIVIDHTVKAHAVSVTADAGTISVSGTLDASGAAPGSITLAAGAGLTLAASSLLDAHGTVLQTDGTGAAIEAENRADVSLSTTAASLVLEPGATINLDTPDPVALGQLILTAPRITDSQGVENGVAISAAGPINILGAGTVALYGSRTYTATDAQGTIAQHDDPAQPGMVSLDQIDADNRAFIAAAEGNTGFAAATAGLGAYHLRPADVIASSSASSGNLTVNGDLDFATLRYGPGANATPGAGEAGMVSLRAANLLTVNGSITDGFGTPPDQAANTPDDTGWVLLRNDPLAQAVTLPNDLPAFSVTLRKYSLISTESPVALNYAITIGRATLAAGSTVPAGAQLVTLHNVVIPPGGITATGTIRIAGVHTYHRGDLIPGGTVITAGSTLFSGVVLPVAVTLVDHTVWPAGALLSVLSTARYGQSVQLAKTVRLGGGAYIPAGSKLKFPGGAHSVALRTTTGGVQGLIYATASLLPPGSQSWSMNLIAGANLASANLLAVQPRAALATLTAGVNDPAGSIVLADTHYTVQNGADNTQSPSASFSVVRTGTGNLTLAAGGNIDQASLFGIYTAGTQTQLGSGQDAAFNAPRALVRDGTILGEKYAAYGAVDAAQQVSYPDHGGDVSLTAQGVITGDVVGPALGNPQVPTDSVGDWLWTQGGAGIGQSTSWWINFGSYVLPIDTTAGRPTLTGFTGIGALGGGNVSIASGQDAGETTTGDPSSQNSQALVAAVASTGRVAPGAAGSTVVLTGGGQLSLSVAGTLNPAVQASGIGGGTLTDMRGDITVRAGQIGRIDLNYDAAPNPGDPRAQDPFTGTTATSRNGPIVVPGDGTVSLTTLRDLVLAGAGDATREVEQVQTQIDPSYLPSGPVGSQFHGATGFSLWTDATAISLFSAGGNLTPTTAAVDVNNTQLSAVLLNDAPTDYRVLYPATLQATAASGNFYYGFPFGLNMSGLATYSLELAPSPIGELSFIAAQSVYAHGYAVDMSGAADGINALPNPLNPAYAAINAFNVAAVENYVTDQGNNQSVDALFAFEADTPTGPLHAGDAAHNRIYAAAGDLVDVQTGEILNYVLASQNTAYTWYLAAKPTDLFAGQDIVSNGTLPVTYPQGYANGTFTTYPNERTGPIGDISSGSLLLNLAGTDISTITAGRDILGSYYYVAGPGELAITAGRNIDQTADSSGSSKLAFGVFKSVGPVIDVAAGNRSGGAGIAILDGAGSSGADNAGFADLYFNNANQADPSIPLSAQPGKVQQTYQDQLFAWLQTNFAYAGDESGALDYYFTLPQATQNVFVRTVFFDELLASGRQESDPASLFAGSYLRGRTAIATLFPYTDPLTGKVASDASGVPYYAGDITMDSGTIAGINDASNAPAIFDAGISTLLGGDIQVISPGGGDTFGTTGGPVPGASSGVITQGDGNIAIYALNSVLLGQSRIFTTFGGNIQIWSGVGDINAGRGAKTTLIVPPPVIAYDSFGDITLAPAVPTSGAGIATLAPIAGVTPGDVDLVAPQGTVDAGEAGIRVSGNLNIAAQQVAGNNNVDVGGSRSGSGSTATVNVASVSAAASAAGAATAAATNTATQRAAAQAVQQQPSIITVEIIGGNDDTKRRRPAA